MSEDTPIADPSSAAKSMPWNQWVNVMIALILVGLAVALVMPAIQQAREAARRSQTSNNLKQIGMSMWNYHDVHRAFPPGGIVDVSGRGHHGWMHSILPYIDQNPYFADVDRRVPWDVNINRHRYRISLKCYHVPGVAEVVTTDGFPVTHFMANPAVMFRNSSMRIRDFKQGVWNTWLVGEAGGEYQPWGYPFNWRELSGPLNKSTGSFGRPGEGGAHFVLGDGSVRFFSDKATVVEPMLAEIRKNLSLPDATLRARPSTRFELTDASGIFKCRVVFLDEGDSFESLAEKATIRSDGRVDFLEIRGHYKFGSRPPTLDDLRRAVAKYPTVERVLLPVPLDDQVAELLAGLPKLTHVYANSVVVSQSGAKVLCGIKSLTLLLVENLDDEAAEHFSACKPKVEIRRGRVRLL
jgi:hypothetical protein